MDGRNIAAFTIKDSVLWTYHVPSHVLGAEEKGRTETRPLPLKAYHCGWEQTCKQLTMEQGGIRIDRTVPC